MKEISEIIGFDLGHGETAIAKVSVHKNEDPQMLEIFGKKSQITAIGQHPVTGKVVIGEVATKLQGVKMLDIGFKTADLSQAEARESIHQFFKAVVDYLIEKNTIRGEKDSFYVVGCPSAWNTMPFQGDTLLEAYQKVLKDVDDIHIKVVPESRAAFMQAREGGLLTIGELSNNVLVIDLGSSTTDLTLVKGGRGHQPFDFGIPLGAAMIDEGILKHSLDLSINKDRRDLRKVFKDRRDLKAKCLIACREAKEAYFNQSEDFADQPIVKLVDVGGIYTFRAHVDRKMIEKVINERLDIYNKRSWKDTLRFLLKETRQKMEEERLMARTLLFTGGASRMDFVRDITRSVFPEKEIRIIADAEPAFAIAKGLTYVGRWDLRTLEFMSVIDTFCAMELPEIIQQHEPALIDGIVPVIIDNVMELGVKKGLEEWRAGRLKTLSEVQPYAENIASAWLESDDCAEKIYKACKRWFEPVRRDLVYNTDQICKKYYLPTGSLNIAPELSLNDLKFALNTKNSDLLEGIAGLVVLVVSIVFASLLGGGGMALLISGPIGWILGFILALPLAGFVGDMTKEWIASWDMPRFIRNRVFSNNDIEKVIHSKSNRSQLEKNIRTKLAENEDSFREMTDSLTSQLQKGLHEKADEVRILVH